MTLTIFPNDPILDLPPWVGQRTMGYRFALSNGVTGEKLPDITPIRSGTLSHNTQSTIKRTLDLTLGITDSARVNPVSDRVNVYVRTSDGVEYPMGKYMFSDVSYEVTTVGRIAHCVLNDEMFLVDQPLTKGVDAVNTSIVTAITSFLSSLPIQLTMETFNSLAFTANQSWGLGAGGGQVVEALAVAGDYFSPWFDNNGIMRFINSFNPALKIPDFDYDTGNKVIRAGIVDTSDVLVAPNRFIVISNNSTELEPVFGVADVSPTAPNSFANRGFYIALVQDLQIASSQQAAQVAINLAERNTIFERVTITSAIDPRHDSYNVIKWQDALWLELSWTMNFSTGTMDSLLRKAYAP